MSGAGGASTTSTASSGTSSGTGGDVAASASSSTTGSSGGSGGAAAGDPLVTYEVVITPNWVSPADDPTENLNAVWVYPKSPTTPYRSPDSLDEQSRYLLLDPGSTDADGRVGNDDWWFIIERNWPSDYPADNHGKWGRQTNFHNVAGDRGPGGGVGWGFGDGVSAFALDWLPGEVAPEFSVEPESPNNRLPLPVPARDTWHTYVVHFVAGRTDGTTAQAGSLTVWADGDATPVIDDKNINTVQRAKGPDGNDYTQRWMVLWEGDYTSDLEVKARTQLVLTRIGTTFDEAVADRPTALGDGASGQSYRGTGTDLGPPSATPIAPRSTSDSLLPPGL